jgi:hypothetical protein
MRRPQASGHRQYQTSQTSVSGTRSLALGPAPRTGVRNRGRGGRGGDCVCSCRKWLCRGKRFSLSLGSLLLSISGSVSSVCKRLAPSKLTISMIFYSFYSLLHLPSRGPYYALGRSHSILNDCMCGWWGTALFLGAFPSFSFFFSSLSPPYFGSPLQFLEAPLLF